LENKKYPEANNKGPLHQYTDNISDFEQKELFIIDNSITDWQVKKYLVEWCDLAKKFDIATGYFEIGALLALDGKWQLLEKIRILMGDEVTRRTRDAIIDGISRILDDSIEKEKEKNDFLNGVPAIVNGIKTGKIEIRIFSDKKFHAKSYITYSKFEVVGSSAMVGSSNFTLPGLTQNIELNVLVKDKVDYLQRWFQYHWERSHQVDKDILKTIERHTRLYTPYEVYLKSLYEFFINHELTASEWELNKSSIYPILDQYQKDGYHSLVNIASKYNGAFLCDGVGLGKTFIGLMLIERFLIYENKKVVIIVPKSAKRSVWEVNVKRYMPRITNSFLHPFKIITHNDITTASKSEIIDQISEGADIIIIDEAHHFRNRTTNRYKKLFKILNSKKLFLLTATPINNSLFDLLHQIELFTRRNESYFKDPPLGIHSLRNHFINLQKNILESVDFSSTYRDNEDLTLDDSQAREFLSNDSLFNSLVVQRSRSYVKQSQINSGNNEVLFPIRDDPRVVSYSLKKTYGNLLHHLKTAFEKDDPLLTLAIYFPFEYYLGDKEDIDVMAIGRQRQVVGLIRTLFLKRFESSKRAFEDSCISLFIKLLTFIRKNDNKTYSRWIKTNIEIINYVQEHIINTYFNEDEEISDNFEEDFIPEEFNENVKEIDTKKFDVTKIILETLQDLNQLAIFITDFIEIKFTADDKLDHLVKLLLEDESLKEGKVIIFSEYLSTAQYLYKELKAKGFDYIDEIDSQSTQNREAIIEKFSPYYNNKSTSDLEKDSKYETRILIATDILSEGINLQDATLLINYDIHWNPVRLLQRIGRIDRRLNRDIEDKISRDHPDRTKLRGKIKFWNFLPPDELDELLQLFKKVSKKTLLISKVFGIQGKKLFRPEDDFEALKEFNHEYEGDTTNIERMRLLYQNLLNEDSNNEFILQNYPLKVFSGKWNSLNDKSYIFFCYNLPGKDSNTGEWIELAGFTKWYLYNLEKDEFFDDPSEILNIIQCEKDSERIINFSQEILIDCRKKIENKIKNSYLKSVQAPIGVRPILKAWLSIK
jgi:superfamily II DNA or RNA helicase